MQNKISTKDLVKQIKEIFLDKDKFQFAKHIVEFQEDGKFTGDCFNFFIYESRGDKPPIFYHTFSPYDLISKKAPDQALVFEDGKLLLNVDFTEFVKLRTGIMDPLLLQTLGIITLKDKKILYFGTGSVARASLKTLKALYPDLSEVDFINRKREDKKFEDLGKELNVEINKGDSKSLSQYDYIFCHTNASSPLLNKESLRQIKKGAIITTFISSTDNGEIADEFYTNRANIIVDWEGSLNNAKDLRRSIDNKIVDEKNIVLLKELFSESKKINLKADYTIFRSTGTPMQNLAVLKLLI